HPARPLRRGQRHRGRHRRRQRSGRPHLPPRRRRPHRSAGRGPRRGARARHQRRRGSGHRRDRRDRGNPAGLPDQPGRPDPGQGRGRIVPEYGDDMRAHRARSALAAATLVTVTLLAAACGGSYGAKHAPAASQVFTYDTTATVMDDGWDPATEYSDGIIAMSEMYETLTRYNSATHKVDPLLATSWSKSANGLTWTFHLRHGVHFHTGRLMTAPE